MDTDDPCSIVNTRVIAATPGQIFAAFEHPERLTRWWGPDGFTSTFEHFEFRPGGEWRFMFHGPGGKDYPNRSAWREIDRPARIVLEHLSNPHYVLTMTFDLEPGGTRITWRQRFDSPKVRDGLLSICEPANEQNLDRLEAELQRT